MEISFTRYRIYRECPWKYKTIFLDGRRVPPTPKASFGLSLHRAIEAWLLGGDDSAEALSDRLRASWVAAGYADEKEESRWYAKAERVLARFQAEESSRRARTLGVEKEFVWPLGGHTVRGMIDRLDQRPDGSYEVIDYKTGPAAPTGAQAEADLQLRFYALGAARGLSAAPSWLTLDNPVAGERVSIAYDPSREGELAADIARAADDIEAARFEPDLSYCPRCDFRRDCARSVARGPA